MTGKQRAFAVINGKTPDRAPVFASTLAGAAQDLEGSVELP